jgi:uncharacterized protein (TIGR02466 family)
MKKPKAQVDYWFPTPIWKHTFESIQDSTYEDAIAYCIDYKNKSDGRIRSNAGGWQSNDLVLSDIIATPLEPFFTEINLILPDIVSSIASPISLRVTNFWININKKGDGNLPHNHPNSQLSGAFYLTDNNSPIKFLRESTTAIWWLSCLGSKNDRIHSFTLAEYFPKKGSLLIFPSWLNHYVEPSESDQDRISISFNTI